MQYLLVIEHFVRCVVSTLCLHCQGLAFRRSTHQLFSCSHDRAVKIWNVDEMAYVDTL